MGKVDRLSTECSRKLIEKHQLHFHILVQMESGLSTLAETMQGLLYILSVKEKYGYPKTVLWQKGRF